MGRPHIAAVITTVVGCIALAGCSSSGGQRQAEYHQEPLRGDVYYRDSDHTLHVLSCAAEFRMAESVNQVTIVTAAFNFSHGEAALLGSAASCRVFDFTLSLHAPLGGRRVVDGTTSKEVPVEDWTRRFYSSAPETPAPSPPAGS